MKKILITGGAGFVGSNLAILLRKNKENLDVLALDNLKRRGSELNLERLKQNGIEFIHGDIRDKEDLENAGKIDMILECSAEPSVLAGYNSSPDYLIKTNLIGTINCLEIARKHSADFIFLSTSRVYPIKEINKLNYYETETRFEISENQDVSGISEKGLSENFPLAGTRSLYGTTKLASELIIQEYIEMYDIRGVINRCGLLTGPWQMGKADQGVIVFWAANHIFQKGLSYLGYGGSGKQVRDLLHINDLYSLLALQMENLDSHNGEIYNVGGGRQISLSLKELTKLCQKFSGNTVDIKSVKEDRVADIRIFLTDHFKITEKTGWKPQITPPEIIKEIVNWIQDNRTKLEPIFG